MVFENLTLIELNLEDARIGPRFGREAEAAPTDEAGDGPRLGPAVAALLLLGIVGALLRRRLRGGAGGDSEQITIQHAAEQ